MTSPSWFRFLRFDSLLASSRGGRKPRHRIARRLLSLERLEDRMVPSTASSNVAGGLNNATINPAPASIGLVLPTPSQQNSGVAVGAFPVAVPTTLLSILATTQNLGQLSSQLQGLSVNSLGQTNSFLLASYTTGAFGFGSGTQPGQPWVGAAYNVGLANHQFSFSSNSDQGFQVPPPWSRSINYNQENDGEIDQDSATQLIDPAQASVPDEDNQETDEGFDASAEDISADGAITRTQPRMEHATDEEIAHEVLAWEDGFSYEDTSLPGNLPTTINRDGASDESEPEAIRFSDLPTFSRTFGLSSLTPIQFSALLTGLAMSALQVKSTDEQPAVVSDELEEQPVA